MSDNLSQPSNNQRSEQPVFGSHVSAGFPSPADDYIDCKLDLNEYLIPHKEATFFLRVQGDSMIGAGIHHGDLVIVDRSLPAANKRIVVAVIDGELTIKRLHTDASKTYLAPENPNYSKMEIGSDQTLQIWGVVTSVIHKV